MDELISFLRRMLDEDERRARACAEVYPAPWDVSDRGHTAYVRADAPGFRIVAELEQDDGIYDWLSVRLDHIARHDPARVLADVAAKRAIVALHQPREMDLRPRIVCLTCQTSTSWGDADEYPCQTVKLLALPYADHADYRAEWRP